MLAHAAGHQQHTSTAVQVGHWHQQQVGQYSGGQDYPSLVSRRPTTPEDSCPAPSASRLPQVVQPRLQVLVDAIPGRRQGGRAAMIVGPRRPSAAACRCAHGLCLQHCCCRAGHLVQAEQGWGVSMLELPLGRLQGVSDVCCAEPSPDSLRASAASITQGRCADTHAAHTGLGRGAAAG